MRSSPSCEAADVSQLATRRRMGGREGEEARRWRILPAFLRRRSKTPVKEERQEEGEAALVEEQSRKLGMRGRLSWTYGSVRRRPEGEAVEGVGEEQVEEVELRPAAVERRDLQRGSSHPGPVAGGISKEEAKRRLVSWRRTTIVRKSSEQS